MLRIQHIRQVVLIGLAASQLAVAAPAPAHSTFEGQTIRIAVASTSGGPLDIQARQFAPFIARYIPGKPSVVVENRPGAGGTVAANYIYNLAKPDGQTIGLLFGVLTQGLIGGETIRFDATKFHWLGAVSTTGVLLARNDLNLSSFRDLLKPAKPLVFASLGTSSSADLQHRLFLDMIGAKYKYVAGYPGSSEVVMALSRGEASLTNLVHTQYLPRRDAIRKEGIYDAIVQRGELAPDGTFRRNRQMPELATALDAITALNPAALNSVDFATYRSIAGSFAVHFSYMLPPATPPAIVSTLRKAMSDAHNDPEARKSVSGTLNVDYDFVNGELSQRHVEKIREEYHSDKRIAERLKQLMESK